MCSRPRLADAIYPHSTRVCFESLIVAKLHPSLLSRKSLRSDLIWIRLLFLTLKRSVLTCVSIRLDTSTLTVSANASSWLRHAFRDRLVTCAVDIRGLFYLESVTRIWSWINNQKTFGWWPAWGRSGNKPSFLALLTQFTDANMRRPTSTGSVFILYRTPRPFVSIKLKFEMTNAIVPTTARAKSLHTSFVTFLFLCRTYFLN